MAADINVEPPNNTPMLNPHGLPVSPWALFFTRLKTANSGNAPADAEYVLGAANGFLPNGRVGTISTTIDWSFATPGQAKVNLRDTAVTPGTYGDSTHVGQFTVDQQGRLTFAGNVALAAGDVVGPGSATDNAISRFDGTTGKLIQNSGITIADGASGTLSNTNTGDQNLFQTIAVSGQSSIVADSTADTLTVAAGSNITITTDASTDTLTIEASASGTTVIGLERQLGDGSTTDFYLPDLAEYVVNVSDAGLIVDPTLYSLGSAFDLVSFATAPTVAHVLTFEYVLATA